MGKRINAARELLIEDQVYPLTEAIELVKKMATAKFTESFDVSINLGIDPNKSDQVVRGSTVMPNGLGKTVRIAVFAQNEQAEAATAAGADKVGMDELADEMKKGDLDFDVVIATPDSMRVVGQLGQVLGPRGLMPNPKVGTVTADVAAAVNNAKSGQVRFRADKSGIIHASIGNADFDAAQLEQNFKALLDDLVKAKPASAKGVYVQKVAMSSTMSPGVRVDRTSLDL